MNWDHVERNWDQFKIIIRQQWGKLTASQMNELSSDKQKLVIQIQETYSVSKDEAESQVDAWLKQQDEEAYLLERATERNGEKQ
jgi:uncharacterized protein YjbJ (UPF0337 family)